jgi:hypothetical protein
LINVFEAASIHMSGTQHCVSASPLRLISLHQIASSAAECTQYYPARPYGLSYGAILFCDPSPSAARALTSHPWRGGSLLASPRRASLEIRGESRSLDIVFEIIKEAVKTNSGEDNGYYRNISLQLSLS